MRQLDTHTDIIPSLMVSTMILNRYPFFYRPTFRLIRTFIF